MFPFTGTLDLTSAPLVRGIHSVHISNTVAAAVVNFRNGSSTGAIFLQVQVAIGASQHVNFSRPVQFPKGVYVEVVSGTVVGSVQPG